MNQIALQSQILEQPAPLGADLNIAAQTRHSMSPLTLAHLNIGLFRYLCKLGTPRERICAALTLSTEEYDYISGLVQDALPGR